MPKVTKGKKQLHFAYDDAGMAAAKNAAAEPGAVMKTKKAKAKKGRR